MSEKFFSKPIMNSSYEYSWSHWELDAQGQPTQQVTHSRRKAEFITQCLRQKRRKIPTHWPASGSAMLCTMTLVKWLEFRATAVMACDNEAPPSRKRLECADDTANLEEINATVRHLLYVACTRARDRPLVTSGAYPPECLEDLTDREDDNGARESDWEEPHD